MPARSDTFRRERTTTTKATAHDMCLRDELARSAAASAGGHTKRSSILSAAVALSSTVAKRLSYLSSS